MSNTNTLNIYGFVTPTHTKNTKRPDCYTAKAWEEAIYGAYIGLVNIANRRMEMDEYLTRNMGLFNACGMPADEQHFFDLLTAFVSFHKDKESNDPKALEKKVSRKYQVARFFNGDWMRYEVATVKAENVKAPKPATPKATKTTSKKGPTKAELSAQNAELLKQLEALKAALGIAA